MLAETSFVCSSVFLLFDRRRHTWSRRTLTSSEQSGLSRPAKHKTYRKTETGREMRKKNTFSANLMQFRVLFALPSVILSDRKNSI